ncbi:ribonuclease HI family protein [Gracilibacillus oryzae]|uniref:Ribonuclease HI family protein n=1 Tax=Gracilibacillus oryzae TaxID=1672701 RepID=A0A7C8KTX6_9BACI|nr:ribonuclease HI family protein [Gracilibacillus oryzae]KAB8138443.1 ribonuclease HI family protein [Gracilibacillus oryzae]
MLEVYTDAATKGNPGPSGIGVYMKKGKEMFTIAKYIGEYSNHEAEFIAIIEALDYCQKKFPEEIISVRSDSKLVVETLEKQFVKNKVFKPYYEQITEKAKTFPYFFIKWIPEKQNSHADKLAREALYQQED